MLEHFQDLVAVLCLSVLIGTYALLGVLTRTLELERERKKDYLGLGVVLKQELVKELTAHAAKQFAELLSKKK